MLNIEQVVKYVSRIMTGLNPAPIFQNQTCGQVRMIMVMGHFGTFIALAQLAHPLQYIGLILYRQILGKIGLGELDVL